MDFEYEYDEREKDGMIIEIDDFKVDIPEELVQERMALMHFFNKEELKEDVLLIASMLQNEYPNKLELEKQLLQYLKDETSLYRPL